MRHLLPLLTGLPSALPRIYGVVRLLLCIRFRGAVYPKTVPSRNEPKMNTMTKTIGILRSNTDNTPIEHSGSCGLLWAPDSVYRITNY
jgi:hypothetical protein